jgi:PPOX class probable F420-dependent enzyme
MSVSWPPQARELVRRARVGRLATSDAANRPHAIPICYACIDDFVYSVIDAKPKRNPLKLKRLRNISENPQVALVVDHYDDDWSQLAWVLLRGRCQIVTDEYEYGRALAALQDRYPQYRDMGLAIDTNPMMRITLERVIAWAHGVAKL